MPTKIQFRRDTAANWTSNNPVLGSGEPGYETDTGLEKRGDGTTAWNTLPYLSSSLQTTTRAAGFTFGMSDRTALQDISASARVNALLPAAVSYPVGTELNILNRGTASVFVLPEQSNIYPYPNGSDGSTTGWSVRNSTISNVPAVGPFADAVVRATATAASGSFGSFGTNMTLSQLGLKSGDIISFRAWLKAANGGTNALFGIRAYYGSTSLGEVQTSAVAAGGGYASLTGYVVPDSADQLEFVTYATSSAIGSTLDMDLAHISLNPTAPSAFYATSSPTLLSTNREITAGGRAVARLTSAGWVLTSNSVPADVMRTSQVLTVDRDNGQAGIIAPSSPLATATTLATSTNRGWFVRFVPSRLTVASRIAFRVSTAAASDVGVVGAIYSSALAKLSSSGIVSGLGINSTGTKSVTFAPVVLQPGVVYYAELAVNGTPTLASVSYPTDLFGAATPVVEAFYTTDGYTGGGPANATVTAVSDVAPILAVRES